MNCYLFFIKLSECIFLYLESGKLLFNNYFKYNVYKLSLEEHFNFELLICLVQYVDLNYKILIKKNSRNKFGAKLL